MCTHFINLNNSRLVTSIWTDSIRLGENDGEQLLLCILKFSRKNQIKFLFTSPWIQMSSKPSSVFQPLKKKVNGTSPKK